MRLILGTASAVLLASLAAPVTAPAGGTAVVVDTRAPTDMSAGKKKAKKKKVQKEEYLRAAPMEPPARGKK
ncbi:MAG: hypothetical protein M5U07_19810 [Xanthobacteraceae bacterium]|nr:hypothetical protein [Xanthobacteraceae bacterium]